MNTASFRIWTITVSVMAGIPSGYIEAGPRTKVAQETAEYVLQRFGREAAREGATTLARRIETYAARHGDEFLKAVRQVGPRTFHLIEEAGAHGHQAVQVLARHGEHGAMWVVSRPKGMQLFLKHGDDAAMTLVKHKGIAEPVIDKLGQRAIRALQATSVQNGRRLGMMLEGGEFTRLGRTQEVLEIIGKYGDRAMTFVWEHKGALATTVGLTAFLANPEAFITGAKDLTQIVGENAIKPIVQLPGAVITEVARGTNWTVIFLAAGTAGLVWFAARHLPLRRWIREKLMEWRKGHARAEENQSALTNIKNPAKDVQHRN